jgi:hypothetical protein
LFQALEAHTLAGRQSRSGGAMNKSTQRAVFRAFMFGVLAFFFLSLMRIEVRSALDVAGFILGAAAIWYMIEWVLFRMAAKKPPGPPGQR